MTSTNRKLHDFISNNQEESIDITYAVVFNNDNAAIVVKTLYALYSVFLLRPTLNIE